MIPVREIDGSYGEGGGQVLRTSLAIASLTGEPVEIVDIRAGRPKPGLAAQHLAVVRALAQITGARVDGAQPGSRRVSFRPGRPAVAGDYDVDVSAPPERRSAGSTTLLLHALLPPLAAAGGVSRLLLHGGTHVPWSPPVEHVEDVFLPAVSRLGIDASLTVRQHGFYPAGGGTLEAVVRGGRAAPRPLDLAERGDLLRVRGVALVSTPLDRSIAGRMAEHAAATLARHGLEAEIAVRQVPSPGPGAALILIAVYEAVSAGFSALGARGVPAERVAEEACRELLAHHAGGAPVEVHLADQLVLPAALAGGTTRFRAGGVTGHLRTVAHIVGLMLGARVAIAPEDGGTATVTVEGRPPSSAPCSSAPTLQSSPD